MIASSSAPHRTVYSAETFLQLRHGVQARAVGVEPWATWLWSSALPPILGDGNEQYTIAVWRMAGRGEVTGDRQHAPHTDQLRAEIHHVIFGDVWLCAGQSNMQHALGATLNRNRSLARAREGKYENVRLLPRDYYVDDSLFPLPTSESRSEWTSARHAAADPNGTLLSFCAACWYFAESLTDTFLEATRKPPNIGLVCSAAGGSHIEQYFPDEQPASSFCAHVFAPPTGVETLPSLFPRHVKPLIGMSLKGFIWWQGENNVRIRSSNQLPYHPTRITDISHSPSSRSRPMPSLAAPSAALVMLVSCQRSSGRGVPSGAPCGVRSLRILQAHRRHSGS